MVMDSEYRKTDTFREIQSIQDMEEPAVNMAAGDFRADVTGGEPDEGKSGTQNVPDE